MIFVSETVRSERNSISAVSAVDKLNARPRSSVVRTVTSLRALDVAMQHLFQSLLAKGHFPFGGLLRPLLKCVKHQDRLSQLDEVEHPHGGVSPITLSS
jgi:hypothetical protein